MFANCHDESIRWLRMILCSIAAAMLMETTSCATATAAEEIPLPPMTDPSYDTTGVVYDGLPTFGAPLWTSYALTDALFWGRDNQAVNRPLVVAVGSDAPVISAQDLQFPFSEGVRAFYGQRQPCECGWELGYFGVYGQSATEYANSADPAFLQMPPDIGSQLSADAENATVKYSSVINSAEANVFSTTHEWRESAQGWLTVDWLAGFRYVGVEEQASIEVDSCSTCVGPNVVNVPYSVRTRNNMFGAQIGNRSRLTWQRWALEGWAKAGLLGNSQEQLQSSLIDYRGFEQRGATSSWGTGVGFIGDINMSAIYRLTDVWGIRAGYNLIWIDGLALAPNQFDFTVNSNSGTNLVSGGGIFMQGANLGLEARW
jgi:hypothetical protein